MNESDKTNLLIELSDKWIEFDNALMNFYASNIENENYMKSFIKKAGKMNIDFYKFYDKMEYLLKEQS